MKKSSEGQDDGVHIEYEEDEPDMYHGWTGSWAINENEPKSNDFLYGVKFGTILHHAEEQAKKMLTPPLAGPKYSSPYARFHTDMSKEETLPKSAGDSTVPRDIEICRANRQELSESFVGDTSTAYSENWWTHDGRIGFAHTGCGWKNREFRGVLYSFDVDSSNSSQSGYSQKKLKHEFWGTPGNLLADDVNDTAWVQADRRIKGFSVDRSAAPPQQGSRFYTKYIFQLENNPKSHFAEPRYKSKRRKVIESRKAEHGSANLLVFGSNSLGYIDNGYLQQWKLDEAHQCDGVRRMVDMENVEEQIAQWPADDVFDSSDNTWMDDTGRAEVSRGMLPDSIRPVDIVTPSSIGYLPNNQFAFTYGCFSGAHFRNGQIPIYDYELQEVATLAGMCDAGVNVVQRPTFGNEPLLVANDSSCVKIFDLRSGKAEVTICQRAKSATPVFISDAKFVANRLYGVKGTMVWDIRVLKPMDSLPINPDKDIAWIPMAEGTSKPPILMCSDGSMYQFDGKEDDLNERDLSFRKDCAESIWSYMEENTKDGEESCSIM